MNRISIIGPLQEKCAPMQVPTSDEVALEGSSTAEKPSKGITATSMAAVVRTASRTSMGKAEFSPKPSSAPAAAVATLKQTAAKPPPELPPPPATKEPLPSTSANSSRKRHDSQGKCSRFQLMNDMNFIFDQSSPVIV